MPATPDFVHLHLHSEYSMLDGACRIDDIVSKAVELEMPAVGLTDHGVMYGSMEFYLKCKKAGIKPLVGCCLPGQLIYTESGAKPIEEIEIGEKVLTHEGRFRSVTRTMTRQYEGTIYGVRAANSNIVWLTDEHPILVSAGGKGEMQWVRADSLEAGRRAMGRRGVGNWKSYVAFPRLRDANRTPATTLSLSDFLDKNIYDTEGDFVRKAGKFNKWDHSIENMLPNRVAITPTLMRLLGLFVAEGSYHRDIRGRLTTLVFTFGHDEQDLVDFVRQTLCETFGLASSSRKRPHKSIIEVYCHSTALARVFHAWCGLGCANKRIPEFIYSCSQEHIRAFVDGLVDGDGKRDLKTGQVTLKMTSRNVVFGTRLLIAGLGYAGVASRCAGNRLPTYCVSWVPAPAYRRHETTDKYLLLPLKEVQERHYDGPVYNLEVEEDHSYVTDFAVHNCEVYVATRQRHQRESKKLDDSQHLVLLAQNETGYKNLLKLTSLASMEGFYYKPRIDKELLNQYSEGLICLSACLGGEVPEHIMDGNFDQAKRSASEFKEIFGDRYYLEMQDHHSIQKQKDVNHRLIQLSQNLDIPLVVTNDVHYLNDTDADPHQVLLCVQTSTTMDDPKKMNYGSQQFYLKNQQEMYQTFTGYEHALARTREIADRCELNLEFGRLGMPSPGDTPEGMNAQSYLAKLAFEGMRRRYPIVTPEHEERLRFELDVIEKTGFGQYFLIVRDFANFARREGIFFGVRGSAAGSMCSYCVDITDVDPLEYGLTFERFLNPERLSMPDIDMDFEDGRRQEVIDYVVNKYGRDRVAQIITFGTLAARAAIRDCGRAMNQMPMPEIDKLCKMIPTIPVGMKIDKALEVNPEFKAAYEGSRQVRDLIDTAKRLEGLTRHDSVHAAGVVIAADPLWENVPVQKADDGIGLVTGYPANVLEKIGLLKMDFLGLANLTILARAVRNIKRNHGVTLDVQKLPLDDRKTYDLLGRGECSGVFQLEGGQMRRYIAELRPNNVGEVAAMVALYRPGPMAQIPKYIKCKLGMEKIVYPHAALEPILKETFGIIVYQDQVLRIVQAVAGFSLGQADILRKAMGKKSLKEMVQQRENFMAGAAAKGVVDAETAQYIFDLIEPFAGYAFNKAHAFCYALVAYQTAYLKANYPIEFFAALMAVQADDTDKLVNFIEDAKRTSIEIDGERRRIEILPPDVNESDAEFLGKDATIRFGLLAIKNVGKAPIEAVLAARADGGPFTSLHDFCARVHERGLTGKGTIETLIKAGALSSLEPNRARLLAGLEGALGSAATIARDRKSGQVSMFGDESDAESMAHVAPPLPDAAPLSRAETTAMEKELLGLYLSDHPLDQFADKLKGHVTHTVEECRTLGDKEKVQLAGVLTNVRPYYTKAKNELMYFLTLEDKTGTISVTLFPRAAATLAEPPQKDSVVIVIGSASHRDRISKGGGDEEGASAASVEISADKIAPVANADTLLGAAQTAQAARDERPAFACLHIRLDESMQTKLRPLQQSLNRYKSAGGSRLLLHIQDGGKTRHIQPSLTVAPDQSMVTYLRSMLGNPQAVWTE